MRNTITITVVAALFAACSLAASEFNWKQLSEMHRSGEYAKLETAASEMKASAKLESQKGAVVTYIAFARQKLGRYANGIAALADVDALAKEIGLPASSDCLRMAKVSLFNLRGEYETAVEISADWKGPGTLFRRAHSLYALKRYAEAAADFAACGRPGAIVAAARMALLAKLPEKVYEYSFNAFSGGAVKDPVTAISLVNAVIDANYTGTTITPAKVKEFLQLVNRKYSRKLVVNAPSKWDELIQLVRQTLETY